MCFACHIASGHFVLLHQTVTTSTLADVFRIFTKDKPCSKPEMTEPHNRLDAPQYHIHIATKSQNENGNNARAGAGIHVVKDQSMNTTLRIPDEFTPSQSAAQLTAIIKTAEMVPKEANITIISSAKNIVKNLTSNLEKGENEDHLDATNSDLLRTAIARLRKRTGKTAFKLIEKNLKIPNYQQQTYQRQAET